MSFERTVQPHKQPHTYYRSLTDTKKLIPLHNKTVSKILILANTSNKKTTERASQNDSGIWELLESWIRPDKLREAILLLTSEVHLSIARWAVPAQGSSSRPGLRVVVLHS